METLKTGLQKINLYGRYTYNDVARYGKCPIENALEYGIVIDEWRPSTPM
jgi:hypothetical protein